MPGDGAEVGDDLADFFAQKIGRKAVGETVDREVQDKERSKIIRNRVCLIDK